MREIMRPIISVEEAEELATHGYAAIRCNLIAEELQILCSEIQTLPAASGTTIHTAAMLLLKAHDEIATANRERLEVREDGDIIDGQDRPEACNKNTAEALQKIAKTLLIDLEKTADCSEWECSECPFMLKEIEDDPRYGRHHCGWLLLKSATSKILRK